MEENPGEEFDCDDSQRHLQAKRINFRSETYACSSDRTTIEDMADHVISRVIDTAAICVQNSLGFTFLHPSREEIQTDEPNPNLNETTQHDLEGDENEDSFATGTEGMTFPVSRRQHFEAKRLSRSNTITGAPIIVLEETDYPLIEGFTKSKGSEFIEKVVESWELNQDSWTKRLEFLRNQTSPNKTQFFYNAIFTPTNAQARTKRKIQVTAQVEFILTVNHLDPGPEGRVTAEFRLEGQRFRHAPGQFRFRECWLQNIIDKKQKLIRQITL